MQTEQNTKTYMKHMERRLWLNGHVYKDHLLIDGGEDWSPHMKICLESG